MSESVNAIQHGLLRKIQQRRHHVLASYREAILENTPNSSAVVDAKARVEELNQIIQLMVR